jgi:hypothetical protein
LSKPAEHAKKHALTPQMHKHKFKPGQSGNPAGRKPGSGLTDLLRKEIEKIDPTDENKRTYKEKIVIATMRLAIRGNAAAMREIWERMDGKVMQPIGGDLQSPVSVMITTLSELFKDVESNGKDTKHK